MACVAPAVSGPRGHTRRGSQRPAEQGHSAGGGPARVDTQARLRAVQQTAPRPKVSPGASSGGNVPACLSGDTGRAERKARTAREERDLR